MTKFHDTAPWALDAVSVKQLVMRTVTGAANSDPPLRANHEARHLVSLSSAPLTTADLASWLLAHELEGDGDSTDLSIAAERVCQRLCRLLSRLVLADGSQAILARALYLARAEFPFVKGISAGRTPDTCLQGLSEVMRDVDRHEALRGVQAVVSELLDLLRRFIGEALTERLLGEGWPELLPRDRVPSAALGDQEAFRGQENAA